MLNVKSENSLDDTGAAFIWQVQLQEDVGGEETLLSLFPTLLKIGYQKVTAMMNRLPRSIHLKWDNPDGH